MSGAQGEGAGLKAGPSNSLPAPGLPASTTWMVSGVRQTGLLTAARPLSERWTDEHFKVHPPLKAPASAVNVCPYVASGSTTHPLQKPVSWLRVLNGACKRACTHPEKHSMLLSASGAPVPRRGDTAPSLQNTAIRGAMPGVWQPPPAHRGSAADKEQPCASTSHISGSHLSYAEG